MGPVRGDGFVWLGLGFWGLELGLGDGLGLEDDFDCGGGSGACWDFLDSPATGGFWPAAEVVVVEFDSQRDLRWDEEEDEGLLLDMPL